MADDACTAMDRNDIDHAMLLADRAIDLAWEAYCDIGLADYYDWLKQREDVAYFNAQSGLLLTEPT